MHTVFKPCDVMRKLFLMRRHFGPSSKRPVSQLGEGSREQEHMEVNARRCISQNETFPRNADADRPAQGVRL